MGKIYDALEKSQKEKRPSIESGKGPAFQFHASRQNKGAALKLLEPLRVNENLDPNLVTYQNPQSIESEMFKILRGNILFPAKGKPPRSILVTSALPGEGKSFVAANLAVSIAQNINEHVLLMDCDIRRPTVHTSFGFDDVPGLDGVSQPAGGAHGRASQDEREKADHIARPAIRPEIRPNCSPRKR